jgi:hypothetical protein
MLKNKYKDGGMNNTTAFIIQKYLTAQAMCKNSYNLNK